MADKTKKNEEAVQPRKQKSEAQRKYRRTQVKRITIDFYPTEADLWDRIESQPQKQTYIKDLIRADLASTLPQQTNSAEPEREG